jgi:NAD(P)H-nitrite reductase large subunit
MDKEFLSQIDQLQDLIPEDLLQDEVLICECFCVSVADIRSACGNEKIVDVAKLESKFGLGTGCQSCLKRTGTWIHNIF